jgi:hypothetical protein
MSEITETFEYAQKMFDDRYKQLRSVRLDDYERTKVPWEDKQCFHKDISVEFIEKHILDHPDILSTKMLTVFLQQKKRDSKDVPNIMKYIDMKKIKEEEEEEKYLKSQCYYIFSKGMKAGERCANKKVGIFKFCKNHM